VPILSGVKWLVLVAAVWVSSTGGASAGAPRVVVLRLDGAVQPASLRYVERGLQVAAERGAELVVLELNTPGGTLVSLRSMTAAITRSQVPVAVYVTPSGGRAASAGFFLLIAADVAAMAPGTNAGAAHPVTLGGRPGTGAEKEKSPDAEIAKAVEDAAALARSLAAERGRPVEWAEKAVRESLSYSADEARRHGLIDVVATERSALLERIDGRTIRRFDGRTHVLGLGGAEVSTIERTVAERVLMVIGDPQVAYLLLLLGFLGLMVELFSPGAVVPGIAGGISLLLALYAFSVLPVSGAAILLIAAGIGLLVAEAFVVSHGLLALTGVASFALGSLMLIDTPIPQWRIGLGLVLPTAAVLGAASLLLLSQAWRLRRAKPRSGLEAMIGEIGEMTSGIDASRGEGTVFVHGEYWTATSERPLPGGARVRVERVEGRRLRVEPAGVTSS